MGLGTEVCHVDDERVALPMAARVAVPLADIGRQMRTCVHDDVALPALPLTHVVEHRNAVWCLDDTPEADASKLRQPGGQAAVRQRAVLGTIESVHPRRVVARWKLRETRRGLG